ncbi:MAG TPA: ferritin family protein [Smithellaceae bacterium]|nr:ferritin family protein [Smithellaceae bacterium]
MKERLNTLEVALKNEMREHEFYKQNAQRTKNPVGRAMFEQIAADELEHYERLQQLHDQWEKEGKWPETVPLKVNDTAVGKIMKKFVKEAKEAPATDADDLKAIQTAIEFEANAATYYALFRNKVTDPKEKAFFDLMANIEHEHYVSLKELEEFYIDPVGWFRRVEKTGLDGA